MRSRRSPLAALTVFAMTAALFAPHGAAATLDAVRATESDGRVQVVLQLSHAAKFEVFTLEDPQRVVVDLANVSLGERTALPRNVGALIATRSGVQPGGTLRLVFEVAMAAEPGATPTAVGRGAQLVIDFKPPTPSAPRAVTAPHAPVAGNRPVIIAIDAGHGGADPGAIGRGGTREKAVVLEIAKAVAARINKEPGMRAVLTRDGDYYIAHRERIRRARAAKADMFVSIHADSIRNPDVSGASVYVLSERGATDEAARWLAERENAADLKGGVSLSDKDDVLASVLLDLSQSASISASMAAAERVLRSIDRVGQVRKPRVQQAGFLVLKSPDIPSMLIETAYISNARDEKRLRSDEFQDDLAASIVSGVRAYFTQHPPEGTHFAALHRVATTASPALASP
jgi:N-acetylmuramoyl-L-alanine amidase